MASNVFTNATKLFGDGDIDWLVDTRRRTEKFLGGAASILLAILLRRKD